MPDLIHTVQHGEKLQKILSLYYGAEHGTDPLVATSFRAYNNSQPIMSKRGKLLSGPEVTAGEVLYIPEHMTITPAMTPMKVGPGGRVKSMTGISPFKVTRAQVVVLGHAPSAAARAPVPTIAPKPIAPPIAPPPPEPLIMSSGTFQARTPIPPGFYAFLNKVLKWEVSVVAHLLSQAPVIPGSVGACAGVSGSASVRYQTPGPCDALSTLYKGYQATKTGNGRVAFVSVVAGLGEAWPYLPASARAQAGPTIKRLLGAVPVLSRLAEMFTVVEKSDAGGEVLELASGVLNAEMDRTMRAGGSLIKKVATDPLLGAQILWELFLFLLDFLPPSMKSEFTIKSAGRKVPVLGTALVGLWDLFSAVTHPTDWKRWAELGSTAVGVIPGAGTAASIAADVGIILGAVAENLHSIYNLQVAVSVLTQG